jgi:hypothetical protein
MIRMDRGAFRKAAIGCGIAFLMGCGESRVAGGTGSETTALGARIVHPDGSPVPDAEVRLIDLDRWGRRVVADSGAAIDSVRTDSSGNFRFEGLEAGAYAIAVDNREEGLYRAGISVLSAGASQDLGNLSLRSLEEVSGTITSAGVRPAKVVLSGIGLAAMVDAAGKFSLPKVPPGSYELLVAVADSSGQTWQRAGKVDVRGDSNTAGLSFQVAPRRIRIEDFDDADPFSSLGPLQGGDRWFYHDDSAYGGLSSLDPVAAESNLGVAMTDSTAWSGKSLLAKLRIGTAGTTQFALVGVEIAPRHGLPSKRGWVDLRSMDSLVFMAKGSGRVRIQFTTRRMAQETRGTVQFEAAFDLPKTWTRFAIPSATIALPANSGVSGVSWSDAAQEVGTINFLAKQDADLWLDDLEITGVGLETFLGGTR